ncbi:MAG: tRNA(Ile)-lysidine synthase [Candidatus Anoxychlamydiales bacterium]|nr:tRNA(Ile)-lysidine synthase [Candidatus Anoxychlamydiales bacterium]NGX36439.1 tRNA(Ile)-lysidine synthase [Candidatus Anoxychlamydiales bacterium]
MDIFDVLKKFLSKNLDLKKPILLGFSGGIDSSALLDLLLKYRDVYTLNLHVATIDHGWREESAIESEIIKKRMKKLNITFHFKKLKLKKAKNLENAFREERFKFFKKLCTKYDFGALLLAHQKDDLAETVLKRILEGANLFNLTSMSEISKRDSMTIWRPLLDVSRKELIKYLKINEITYFSDATNENTKYLRAKMRCDIFPYLKKNFNKQIENNLKMLSIRSKELDAYLETKLNPFFSKLKKLPLGVCIDLNEIEHALELKYILKKISNKQMVDLSRDVIDQLSFWLLEKKANLRLKLKNANLFADRGYFFILKKDFKLFNTKTLLKEGRFNLGNWQVEIRKVNKALKNSTWQDFFNNKLKIYVPKDKYFIALPKVDNRLKKLMQNAKVPSFLRRHIPVLYNKNKGTYDFLSAKKTKLDNSEIWQISLLLK